MAISSAHPQIHFEAAKVQIDVVVNRSEFHGSPLRLVQALPWTLTACEIQELAGLEGKNLPQAALWIPAVPLGDTTITKGNWCNVPAKEEQTHVSFCLSWHPRFQVSWFVQGIN